MRKSYLGLQLSQKTKRVKRSRFVHIPLELQVSPKKKRIKRNRFWQFSITDIGRLHKEGSGFVTMGRD